MESGLYTKLVMMATLLMVCMAANINMASGQCGMSTVGFNACKPACTKTNDGSTPPNPTALCCSAIKQADLSCLCKFANSPFLGAYNIDKDAAMKLPVSCNAADSSFHC